MLKVTGLSKIFGGLKAVDNASLEVPQGSIVALIGPNGAGKTTLFSCIAGFQKINAGKVEFCGEDITGLPVHEIARRGMVRTFQITQPFDRLTVQENIAVGAFQQFPEREAAWAHARRIGEQLGMGELLDQSAAGLTVAGRKRLEVARTLATGPKMLLLDEPLAALDKKLREETQWELMALQQQLGMTFLIVTHDQEEAMVTADRIAVMRAGQIVQMGRPADVYEAPNSRYVADFIGDVNIFEGKAEFADGTTVRMSSAEAPGGFDIIEDDLLAVGSTAWLAVRPEKIEVHLDEPPPGPNRMAGKIEDIGYLGDWTTYLVELESGRTIRAARANATRFVDRPVDWDDQVWLTFARDAGVVLTQ